MVFQKRTLVSSFQKRKSAFFEFLNLLYPPNGSAKALPMGSDWFSYGLLSLENEEWSLNFELEIRQKISVKILYCADGRREDGWTVIKSVLQFSLYFVRIQISYISIYICHQNLSPIFLWVSKFDVKFQNLMSSWGLWSKFIMKSKIQQFKWHRVLGFFFFQVGYTGFVPQKLPFWGTRFFSC